MTAIEIVEESPDWGEYASVSIAFEVASVLELEVVDGGLGGLRLAERPVAAPTFKDYDALEHPTAWARRLDVSRWGVLAAWRGGARLGGAVIAVNTPRVLAPSEPPGAGVLWDLRVAPAVRGQGIGAALFARAEAWAAARGCRTLVVETQNTNVGACRFYARQGCTLGGIRRFAYPQLPDEVELLWRKPLRTV